MSDVSCAGQKWPESVSATAASGTKSCARPPKPEALELKLGEARTHCEAEGARLCESTELRRTGVATNLTAWTNMECASCWHRNAGEHCAAKIDTHKTKGMVHEHKDFSQSWYSGHALAIGADAQYLSTGEWAVKIAGRVYAAEVFLKPFYDPDIERIRA